MVALSAALPSSNASSGTENADRRCYRRRHRGPAPRSRRRRSSSCGVASFRFVLLFLWATIVGTATNAVDTNGDTPNAHVHSEYYEDHNDSNNDDESFVWGTNLDPHPDPNEEHYEDMVYVGRHHHETGRRLSNEHDNHVRFIFGTSFDESHREIAEEDLRHAHYGPAHGRDVADRNHETAKKKKEELIKEAQQRLKDHRHGEVPEDGMPKPFGYVDTHPLDGGVTPPKVVSTEPFFLDVAPVTNKQFAKFVKSTYYQTEAEKFGWSFVLASFLPASMLEDRGDDESTTIEVDPEAPDWVAVEGAYWRRPEGPQSSYKYRELHPVVHVSHKDAAEYCSWVGKRLPGEREYEAAARAGHYGPSNRTLYGWGESDDWAVAVKHANLWGFGAFPFENRAEDGWRGTSPVKTYPANALGFYDTTGNVWEWMRGGKHKARIVRGGSYVDSLDGSVNHAATLGARSTLHATTTTGNVGFRCAKSPAKRTGTYIIIVVIFFVCYLFCGFSFSLSFVEYHWKWHDELEEGQLAVEDQFGHRDVLPKRGWEDLFHPKMFEDDDDEEEVEDDEGGGRSSSSLKRKKVVKRVERLSSEL